MTFLDRLQTLLAKATPGKWTTENDREYLFAGTTFLNDCFDSFPLADQDLVLFLRNHAEAMGEVMKAAENLEQATINFQHIGELLMDDMLRCSAVYKGLKAARTAYHAARKGLEDASS